MKKLYTILAIAAVAAVGCTKVETIDNTPGNKITFQAASYVPQTKANVSVISEFTSFTCKAFLHADGYEGTTQDFFGANGETISPDNTSAPTYWAPSHDYYWPKSSESYINFIAWYDKKGTVPSTATETSLVWENYNVLTTDNLLFADEAWRYKDNSGAIYKKDSVTEGVPMLFHHALAQLCIKAAVTQASDGNTTWDVTLTGISLGSVYSQGTLSLTNTDPASTGTSAWSGSWTPSGTAAAVAMSDVTTPLTTTATEVLAMQNVLPQTLTDDNVLNFTVKISYKYSGTEYAHEAIDYSVKLTDFTNAISAWEMNKKITYTITINPVTTVVKIDPAMEEWEAVAGGTYTI